MGSCLLILLPFIGEDCIIPNFQVCFVNFSLDCHIFGALGEINLITLHKFYIDITGFKRLDQS